MVSEWQFAVAEAQNLALKRNISCLYKTAKLEIDRKTSEIQRLRAQLADKGGATATQQAQAQALLQQRALLYGSPPAKRQMPTDQLTTSPLQQTQQPTQQQTQYALQQTQQPTQQQTQQQTQ